MRRIRQILDEAAGGRRQVIVVAGELGIGKSAITAAGLTAVDANVVVGGCLPVEDEAIPFAPVTAALRQLLPSLEEKSTADLVRDWPSAFADFLPFGYQQAHARGAATIAATDASSTGQARLFEWLLNVLCTAAGERALVWVVEDAQWSDRSTLDLVAFLARNLDREPITLIVTVRTDEIDRDHPLRRWLVELERLDDVTRISLGRLSYQATRAQIVELSPDPVTRDLTDLVYQHSAGNPLFTGELIAWAHEPASQWPDTLYDLIASRLVAVPTETRSVLDAAAAIGASFSIEILADVRALGPLHVEAMLGPAVERHLIEPRTPDDYTFGPLVQQVLEAELRPGERRLLHQGAARAKEGRLEDNTDTAFELVAQIAHHWEVAQVEPKAFAAIVRAARSAARLYAVTEADEYFSRALAMDCAADESIYRGLGLDRLDLLLEASQAAHMVGDGTRAIDWVDAAAGLATDTVRLAAVLERKGAYCFNTGKVEEADRAYREALRMLPDVPSPLRAQALGGLALLSMAWSRMTEAEALCHRAIRDARAVDARHAEVRALNALGVVMSYRGEVEQGILHSREAVAIAEELDSPDDMATAYIDLAHVLDLAGRFGEAVEVCRVGYDAMRRVGLARQDGSFLQANAAESLVKAGRWEQAADLLAQAQAVQMRGLRVFPVLEHEARLRTRKGELATAEECVQRARRLFEEFDAPDAWHREFHEVASELYLWQGRLNDALNEAHAGLVLVKGGDEERMAGPLILTALQALADLIQAARAQSDDAGLERLLAEAAELRERASAIGEAAAQAGFLLPEAAAVLQTVEAEYARCAGLDCTAERWAAVADRWVQIGQPFGAVYARWRQAEILVMSREIGQRPVAAVRRAHEAAQRLGARAIVDEVENLARWGRVTLHPGAVVDVDQVRADQDFGLTRREQEVLAGLLAGKTNREIAEAMFISTKTSSVHVSNILRKLGVKSREEAARVAHRRLSGS